MVPYTTYEDGRLLVLLSSGDHEAFTEIYNRYWDKILYIAGIKTKSLAIAEEIVQDIFLDLWERRAQLNITGNLESYLAVAVKYRIINIQAKQKRAGQYADSLTESQQADTSTQEWLDFHELQERLARLVNKLPEKCRLTYTLSRDKGLSQKEVAHELQISEKAVEANMTRALKALRSTLKNFLFSFLNF